VKDVPWTPMPPRADIKPELVSRLAGLVPRCSALPRGEPPIWVATSVPAASISETTLPARAFCSPCLFYAFFE
jgi:hypothetical protein